MTTTLSFILKPNLMLLLLALYLIITLGSSDPTCGNCGYPPINGLCCQECAAINPQYKVCVPSCNYPCKQDSDCGTSPESPYCSACIAGFCRGPVDFNNCTQQNPWQPGQPKAPILPQAWRANFTYVNYTNPTDQGTGNIWYDIRFGGMRIDFHGICPFLELGDGLDNNVPCTVLFYEGYNYYIYPAAGICCGYEFPVWTPDTYFISNASLGGNFLINGIFTDYWRFQYACPWIRPPTPQTMNRLPGGLTTQRDIYLQHGTNIPVRMNETLTSSYTDFFNLIIGDVDETIFSDFLQQYQCIFSDNDPTLQKTCQYFFAHGRLVPWGFN